MALVDVREKSYNSSVDTAYHRYFFGKTEKAKVLDLFNIDEPRNIRYVYGGSVAKNVNGTNVHKGFYVALKDFINKYDTVLVKLTKEEEDFFKKNESDIYKIYVKEHKGHKFAYELEELKVSKDKK